MLRVLVKRVGTWTAAIGVVIYLVVLQMALNDAPRVWGAVLGLPILLIFFVGIGKSLWDGWHTGRYERRISEHPPAASSSRAQSDDRPRRRG